jgi:hypothetical protein
MNQYQLAHAIFKNQNRLATSIITYIFFSQDGYDRSSHN